jgi:hypothetical protein
MIQIGTICISVPIIPSEYEVAKYSHFITESNARRMEYMKELGYYINKYSEMEWQNFKRVEELLRKNNL